MIWHLILSGANSGQYNMDFDIELASKCKEEEAFFRIYNWEPFAISLGANQNIEEINIERCKADKIDVVKRPTGGRAILHADEITYSVIIPTNSGFSSKELYQKISIGLVRGMRKYHSGLEGVELESEQPDFSMLLKQASGSLCFASTAKSEIKFNGKKLVGSAQRKMNKSILQHGSILCGKFHQYLPKYINADQTTKNNLLVELEEKTTEIETILNEKVNYSKLIDCLIEGFQEEFKIKFAEAELSSN